MTTDPKILGLAFLGASSPLSYGCGSGLKEDKKNPEPKGVLTIVFIMGMLAVICVLPIQKFIQGSVSSNQWQLTLWASTEEIFKYLAVLLVLLQNKLCGRSHRLAHLPDYRGFGLCGARKCPLLNKTTLHGSKYGGVAHGPTEVPRIHPASYCFKRDSGYRPWNFTSSSGLEENLAHLGRSNLRYCLA